MTTTHASSVDHPLGSIHSLVASRTLALLAAVAGLVLAAAAGAAGSEAGDWVRAGLVAAFALAAVVLALRAQPRLATTVAAVSVAGGACAASAGSAALHDLHTVAATVIPAVALHLELVVPDGHIGRPTRRNLVVAGYVAAGVTGIVIAAAGGSPDVVAVSLAVAGALVVGLPLAHQTYRASYGAARRRLQLLGCGVTAVAEVGLVMATLQLLVDWPAHGPEVAAGSVALIPLSLAAGTSAGVSRRVDRVLVHAVSATGLSGLVALAYVVVVLGLGRTPSDTERPLLVLSMLAAALIALAYVPARERLAESANRLVYGERHAPDEVLRTWGSRLSRATPMDELLLQLAESLRKVLSLRRAEIWTGGEGHLELAVSVPDRTAAPLVLGPEEQPVVARAGVTGNAWLEVWLPGLLEGRPDAQLHVMPATHSGEVLGLLVVERAAGADDLTEEDDRVLTELARQVALALHNVRLDSALQESLENLTLANAELQASRARIVASGDAERRRIERNLHDGAQQHLVALAVNLRLARDMLSDEPEDAAEMLELLADSVKDTIQELRDLAHGIYPPLLMDSGLEEALRAAGSRSPLRVTVSAAAVGRYPSEVEAAVYFCCLEALQNAGKHAPDAAVAIRLAEEAGSLRFEVVDDGPGFDAAAATSGHGFTNMSDRLGAIGGSVEWRSTPGGGTTISGTIPRP